MEAAGGEARVFDAGAYRRPIPALKAAVAAFRPDVVGLSLRNADNAAWPYTRTYTAWYQQVTAAVRETAPRARLVLGGPAFSIFPREMRRALLVRDGVVGDGEAAAALFATNELPEGIVELAQRDLAAVRLPAHLDAVWPEVNRFRTAGVQSARGCSYRCIYCTYPRLEGVHLRRRHPEAVVDEMERHRRERGAVEQFVVDSSFNADEAHMVAVCEEMRRRRSAARRAPGGRQLLLLPAAPHQRSRRVPPARRGGLHLGRLRHRHRGRGVAAPHGQVVHRRLAARIDPRGARRRPGRVPLAALRGPG